MAKTSTRATYTTEIKASDVPAGVRFDVPRQNQGQIIEVAYGDFGRSENAHGDRFQRVTDTSLDVSDPKRVRYYKRDQAAR